MGPTGMHVQHHPSRTHRWLTVHAVLSTMALFTLAWRSWYTPATIDTDLLRTRGIVVQDSLGRDRILIGAPFPHSTHRIRTDSVKARAAWANGLGGDDYMAWYRDYHHGGNGLLLLNGEGYDLLALGDALPDPNTGKRIAIPTGLVWNDARGFETGGIGSNRLIENGQLRTGLGFDDEGGEGLHVYILEDGSKFIRFVYEEGALFLGRFAAHGMLGDTADFVGFRAMNANGEVVAEENFLERGR